MNFRHTLQKWLLRDPIRYHGLHTDLISSRSGRTLEQYLWKSIRISIVSGVLFGVLGYAVSEFFARQVESGRGIYNVFNLQLPESLTFLSSPTVVVSASVAVSFAFGAYITYHLMLRIPQIEKLRGFIRLYASGRQFSTRINPHNHSRKPVYFSKRHIMAVRKHPQPVCTRKPLSLTHFF